nr:MAG TPA: protein of unknown function (DUF5067) [Bacteriophage sp.]
MAHTCKNCGTEHDGKFCPECGAPVHESDPPDPPRHRGYGAVMVVIGILIGFIIGIAGCMVYGVSLGLVSFEGGLPAIVIQETFPASTPIPPVSDPATSSVSVPAGSTTPASSNSGTLGNYVVKFNGFSLSKDRDGNDAIIINYDFTNNSADPAAALWALDLTSFQGGVALEPAYSVEGCNSDPYYTTEVKDGATISLQSAFLLRDLSTPVEVEASELISYSDKKIVAQFDITK